MKRRGLTMIELLITMSIVAILAGMVLFAMNTAQQSAREARTQATIATLHALVMEHYESYKTRRLPIERNIAANESPKAFAARRLSVLRELMRREMPDRWADVDLVNYPTIPELTPGTALMQAYQRQFLKGSGHPELLRHQSAECLYMLITFSNPDARSLFSDSQIGDVDGDGLPEFLDGWGKPIEFIRWPAGFESDLQSSDPVNDHDPFDPLRTDSAAYRIVPLIFSAGPDGTYNILSEIDERFASSNPYAEPMPGKKLGAVLDTSTGGEVDNIHNHLIGSR